MLWNTGPVCRTLYPCPSLLVSGSNLFGFARSLFDRPSWRRVQYADRVQATQVSGEASNDNDNNNNGAFGLGACAYTYGGAESTRISAG